MTISRINGKSVTASGITINCPYNVSKAWFEPIGQFFIVLMEFSENKSEKRFHNLVAYDSQNRIKWVAELPAGSGADCYTDADVMSNQVSAFTFSGYRCFIAISNGKLVNCEFTK